MLVITTTISTTNSTTTITTTTITTVITILGALEFDVTLPTGVTATDFVNNANVKKGVEQGIAIVLAILSDWVNAVL